MNFYLVLKIVFYVHNKEMVALMDKLLIEWIVNWVTVDSVFDKEHRHVFNSESAQYPLIFSVLQDFFSFK